MAENLKLYSYFRSSCAYRVRIALNLKGLNYDIIPVHLLKDGGQQNSQDYHRLNPSGHVPTLLDGTFVLGQSMAIVEYIEEKFPTPPLLPTHPQDRAIVRQMCEVINSGIQPLQNLSVVHFLEGELARSSAEKQKWLNHWILRGMESLEKLLVKHSRTYCVGDQISLADCFLVPQIFSAQRFNVDLMPFKKCLEINEKCLQLTDFKRAAPDRQPDFEVPKA